MKYKAIIFDLFGTLVDDFSGQEYDTTLMQMASVLEIQNVDFRELWSKTSYERITGGFHSVEDNILYICRELGFKPEENNVKVAAQLIQDCKKRILTTPRSEEIGVLTQLRYRGYKIGLISDCTPDVPAIWAATHFASLFDSSVFSCSVHLRKPDRRIYEYAIKRLGVKPEECLYVGDGGSDELSGASKVGMSAVLIQVPAREKNNPNRNTAEEWNGPIISSLREVLDLLG